MERRSRPAVRFDPQYGFRGLRTFSVASSRRVFGPTQLAIKIQSQISLPAKKLVVLLCLIVSWSCSLFCASAFADFFLGGHRTAADALRFGWAAILRRGFKQTQAKFLVRKAIMMIGLRKKGNRIVTRLGESRSRPEAPS